MDTGTVLADRWVLTQRIGTGASSHVYAARDPRLDRWVAVKVLHASLATDPTFLEQFSNEASAVSDLDADYVVRFYDAGTYDVGGLMVPYIVSALMAGGSLDGILGAGRRLDVAQAVALARGAASGLQAAHAADLVHSDVKPSNLLFDSQGRVALSDFGISRAISAAASTEPIGSASATMRYASPEQMQGRALDGKSDIYSLALVLMEAVTGVVPMLADTIAGTVGLRSQGSVDVSIDFGALRAPLLAATESNPQRRCDAAEFLSALATASERVSNPAPLELVPVDLRDEQTSEFEVESVGGPGIGALAPIVAAGSGARESASSNEDTIDLTGDRSEEAGLQETWAADSIAIADEHARLAEAVPSNVGTVEPLDVSDAPGAVGELGGAVQSKKPRNRAERPRWRRYALIFLAVSLVAAAAVASWWFFIRVPTHEVPALVGDDVGTATAVAEQNSWDVTVLERTRVDGTVADEVIGQDPPAGTDLAEGESLSLTISDGPTLTVVPQIAGLPEPEAAVALDAAGLVLGARSTDFNEDAAAGIVLLFAPADGLQPDANGQVAKGTAVDIIVSNGPAPRVVPGGLVGSGRSAAAAALEAVQLVPEVSSEYSDTVVEGVVISAGAEAGTELPRGTAVSLVVSAGPKPIVVPNVVGQTGSSAASSLESAGFTVSGIEGSPTGTVLATDPVAGESRQPGSSVRIFTRS